MIELPWNAPVSEAKMARCIETLDLSPGQRVLDVGCGCGEVLIRLHERYQIQGLWHLSFLEVDSATLDAPDESDSNRTCQSPVSDHA